jgi:hypothetical protein
MDAWIFGEISTSYMLTPLLVEVDLLRYLEELARSLCPCDTSLTTLIGHGASNSLDFPLEVRRSMKNHSPVVR